MTGLSNDEGLPAMPKYETDIVEAAGESSPLSEEHRQYLLERHGTLDLDPIPQMDDDDPLNWPMPKKILNLGLVALHAMMGMFVAAAIACAFVPIAEDLEVSVQRASYLLSLFIAILGAGPLVWKPLSQTWGRRPVFLLSLACSVIGNVGCAVSPTFATMALCRALTSFFICSPVSLGSGVVHELFFKKHRAQCMGVWATMVTLGIPVAPLIFGPAVIRVGYRWIYWSLAMANGVQLVAHFLFGSETRYVAESKPAKPIFKIQSYFSFRRIDPTPLTWFDFVWPLTLVSRVCIAVPAATHAMSFLWAVVFTQLEIPQLFPENFGLNAQQVGLQNIPFLIGTILGEQIGGFLSDKWMYMAKKKGRASDPEYRLWISYLGHLLVICGVVVFLVQIGRAGNEWNVTPIVGMGIAAAGNQITTTVIITYAVDCHPEQAAGIGVFITFVRQIWGFTGPFWFPQMLEALGFYRSTAVPLATILGITVLPTILLQWKGSQWHGKLVREDFEDTA